MPKNNFSSDLEGFTLVELLVVIAIIAILAAVVLLFTQGFYPGPEMLTAYPI